MDNLTENANITIASYLGFPRDLVALLRCSRDGGALELFGESRIAEAGIVQGRLACSSCGAEYPIEDGIARLMSSALSDEDEHEAALRDEEHSGDLKETFAPPATGWRSVLNDRVEIPAHLKQLQPSGCLVLEIGCGDGRFTLLMAQMGARVLAVDFSINALRKAANYLLAGHAPTSYQLARRWRHADIRGQVGLVQADANHFHIAPRAFDRAFTTTPLDSREQRMALYSTVADALRDEGRFVGSVEHDDLARRLLGLPLARRYSEGGIFLEHFSKTQVACEAGPFFSRTRVLPIRPWFPFMWRLPVGLATSLCRAITWTPVLRDLGEILVLRAEHPVRPPIEGMNRRGNKVAKGMLRWYCNRLGKKPVWQGVEQV